MKRIIFGLVITLCIIACSSPRIKQEASVSSPNPILDLCGAKNSDGLTVDDFMSSGNVAEEKLIEGFFEDEFYLSTIQQLASNFEHLATQSPSDSLNNVWMEEALKAYPQCEVVLPMLMSMAVNTSRE